MLYRLRAEHRGKRIALRKPSILLDDSFLGNGSNKQFVEDNLADLAPYIENFDGSPVETNRAINEDEALVEDIIKPVQLSVKELKEVLKDLESTEDVKSYFEGEERTSAIKAINKRLSELEA